LGALLRPTNEPAQQGEEERAQERHAGRSEKTQGGWELDLEQRQRKDAHHCAD